MKIKNFLRQVIVTFNVNLALANSRNCYKSGKNSTTHKLLNLLHLIFMELKTSEEKEKILREEYDLEISEDMKEELKKMGGLMEPLLEKLYS